MKGNKLRVLRVLRNKDFHIFRNEKEREKERKWKREDINRHRRLSTLDRNRLDWYSGNLMQWVTIQLFNCDLKIRKCMKEKW